jgi:hypothetical protein
MIDDPGTVLDGGSLIGRPRILTTSRSAGGE